MADVDLMCNFKSCLKLLKKSAWVTSCSHIFCDEDGMRELMSANSNCKCPVCGAALSHSSDIVKVELNPTEHFKSMVLTGLSPEIVMDIMNRSFSFWTYQTSLTRKHQEGVIKSYKDKLSKLESSYESLVAKIRQEVHVLRKKVEEMEKERQELLSRLDDSARKLSERNRENQKLHNACNAIRIANLNSVDSNEPPEESNFTSFGPKTMNDLLPRRTVSQPHMPPPINFTPRNNAETHRVSSAIRRKPPTHNATGFRFNPVTPQVPTTTVNFNSFMTPKAPRVEQ
ncbi:E3 ubiquitin-protein ligase CCNB1IP1-like [Cloeon dipterum]|uniref:E3 ubiquitin-protein ligase CCNB1IP1-like n=1 Tax=Cloeon dipterum TaxID=197152 RepID=UPI0032206238